MHALELKHVSKSYNGIRAVDDVSFHIDDGEIFALLGPNGAGKSTILRIIGEGITYEGQVLMYGGKIERWKIGYAPQDGLLYQDLISRDNMIFYALLKKVSSKKALALMKELNIPNKKVRELSGGMRRRLSIAIALIGNPKILILDEPTVGLDVNSRREIWKIIKNKKKEGKAILLTTHYMEEAESLADRIGIIDRGKIIAIDTAENLKKIAGIKSAIVVKGEFEHVPQRFMRERNCIVKFSENPKGELSRVVNTLSRIGEIKEIFIREPTLEDVFLKLTGRRLME